MNNYQMYCTNPATMTSFVEGRVTTDTLALKEQHREAVESFFVFWSDGDLDPDPILRAFAWRGKYFGKLKARAPSPMDDPKAWGAWNAIMAEANPYKVPPFLAFSGGKKGVESYDAVVRNVIMPHNNHRENKYADHSACIDWGWLDRDTAKLRELGVA